MYFTKLLIKGNKFGKSTDINKEYRRIKIKEMKVKRIIDLICVNRYNIISLLYADLSPHSVNYGSIIDDIANEIIK